MATKPPPTPVPGATAPTGAPASTGPTTTAAAAKLKMTTNKWRQDMARQKNFRDLLAKAAENRSLRELQAIGEWLKDLQPDFCASLSPDPRERDDFILRISKYITLIRVEPDDIVVMQGEKGDKFYVMFCGTCDIYVQPDVDTVAANLAIRSRSANDFPSGQLGRLVKRVQPGESFGEVALRQADCMRTATVVANGYLRPGAPDNEAPTPAELLVLTKHVYDQCVWRNNQEGHVLERKIFHIKHMFMFQHWKPSDITFLAYGLGVKMMQDSEYLYRAGEDINFVGIVYSGEIRIIAPPAIIRTWENRENVMYKLPSVELEVATPLDMVGESSILLRQKKHSYSAVAVGPTVVFLCRIPLFRSFILNENKENTHGRQTVAYLEELHKKRMLWYAERLSIARPPGVLHPVSASLRYAMQIGVLPCSRCGGLDHVTLAKFCPARLSNRMKNTNEDCSAELAKYFETQNAIPVPPHEQPIVLTPREVVSRPGEVGELASISRVLAKAKIYVAPPAGTAEAAVRKPAPPSPTKRPRDAGDVVAPHRRARLELMLGLETPKRPTVSVSPTPRTTRSDRGPIVSPSPPVSVAELSSRFYTLLAAKPEPSPRRRRAASFTLSPRTLERLRSAATTLLGKPDAVDLAMKSKPTIAFAPPTQGDS